MKQNMINRIATYVTVFILSALLSCKEEIEQFQIVRNGSMSFNVNGEEWKATNFSITKGPLVIKYTDKADAGSLFHQYSLTGQGKNPDNLNFQISLVFDIKEPDQLIGAYTTKFTNENGGLERVILNQETSNNSSQYTDFQFCTTPDSLATITVDKQHMEEQLVLGTFKANLCSTGATPTALSITNGSFKDISYQ